jgi:RHS repeat-associated protein
VTKGTAETLTVTVAANNRLSSAGFAYDAAGNLTQNGLATYTYDAENRISATAGASYTYDGEGVRVMKSGGSSAPTLYWGSAFTSGPLAESDLAGTISKEFIYFGGKRIARLDLPNATAHYYFSDHLGSANVVTNATGTIEEESDFYPFGGERAITDTLTNQNYKFTGKERDPESGLDYFGARYYASSLGRFLTSDPYMPSADVKDPQSWNRYAYARNNPLRYIDPNGLDWKDLSEEQRRVFKTYADNYNQQNKSELSSEQVYNTLSQSQMATFESVTYALEHTQLVDSKGNSMGMLFSKSQVWLGSLER